MSVPVVPPGFESMFARPRTPEQEAYDRAVKAFTERAGQFEREQRLLLLSHAWLFCTCQKRFDRANPAKPPQEGCIIHSGVLISPEGEVL